MKIVMSCTNWHICLFLGGPQDDNTANPEGGESDRTTGNDIQHRRTSEFKLSSTTYRWFLPNKTPSAIRADFFCVCPSSKATPPYQTLVFFSVICDTGIVFVTYTYLFCIVLRLQQDFK